MWHLHKWSKWKTIEQGDLLLTYKFQDKPAIKHGSYLVQSRSCEKCSKTQLQTERTY